jgi:predicted neutral ceramidase superfamily lipid hydrolase
VAFPIGEAQITGLLNGGSLVWAFISDSILTAAIGFGTKIKSLVFIFMIAIFIFVGTVLYFLVVINLKRKLF